jgi:hypothetical protein
MVRAQSVSLYHLQATTPLFLDENLGFDSRLSCFQESLKLVAKRLVSNRRMPDSQIDRLVI